MSNRNERLSAAALGFSCAVALLLATLPSASGAAAGSTQLRRVQGSVGYQPNAGAPITPIFGKIDLPDEAIAVTQASSVAELALPDSSIVTLGAGTRVNVGAFATGVDGPGSKIVVNSGTLRFDIKRPTGGRANYQFTTATSQIAVRGTIGLLSVVDGITKVACVQCAADSVVVTTGGQTFALATGQILTVTGIGSAVPAAITPADTAGFGSSGVGTGAGGAAAGAGGAIGAAAGAAVLGGALAAGIGRPTNSPTDQPVNPTPQPTATPTTAPTPTATPTKSPVNPTPSPSASPSPSATQTAAGSVTITGGGRRASDSGGSGPTGASGTATAGPGNVPTPPSNRRLPNGNPQATPAAGNPSAPAIPGVPAIPGTGRR